MSMCSVSSVSGTPDIMQLSLFHKSSKLSTPDKTSVSSWTWGPRGEDTVQLRKDTVEVASQQHRPAIGRDGRPNSIPVETLPLCWVRRTVHANQADRVPKKSKVQTKETPIGVEIRTDNWVAKMARGAKDNSYA